MVTGTLFIVSAPSGGGKTSLIHELVESVPDVVVSISHTTRAPRPGEVDGVNYYFVSEEEFAQHKAAGRFLEDAAVFDHHYGTSADWVQAQLASGNDVILEIDWQGARAVREKLTRTVSIFILPPSLQLLASRLHKRGQDSASVIARRMAQAKAEMSHYHEYDYVIVNNEFAAAANALRSVVVARRHELARVQLVEAARLHGLLADSQE